MKNKPLKPLYSCISVDPPWRYRDKNTRGSAERHYQTMSLEEIEQLPIRELAHPQAHIYLWITNIMLKEGAHIPLFKAWGFDAKSIVTWCKVSNKGTPHFAQGHWIRGATEHFLFAVRGNLKVLANNIPSWFMAPRGQHSEKPAIAYQYMEKLSPGPRIELFARGKREGWHSWGDEVDGDIILKNGIWVRRK